MFISAFLSYSSSSSSYLILLSSFQLQLSSSHLSSSQLQLFSSLPLSENLSSSQAPWRDNSNMRFASSKLQETIMAIELPVQPQRRATIQRDLQAQSQKNKELRWQGRSFSCPDLGTPAASI
jgi:hypothetical protein